MAHLPAFCCHGRPGRYIDADGRDVHSGSNEMTGADWERSEWRGWLRLQERLRFEVLRMLYRASGAAPFRRVVALPFAEELGVNEQELRNALSWLEAAGYVGIHGADPDVSITLDGIRYIEEEARRRKTVRGISPPEHSS